MRKFLMFFLIGAFLLSFGLPALAEEQKPSLKVATEDVAEAVRENPVNVMEYTDTTIDFMAEFLKKFLKSAKPMVGFTNGTKAGLEMSLYEGDKFDITFGTFADGGNKWFVGAEAGEFPLSGGLWEIFEKFRPQVLLYDGKFYAGLSYEFRE